MTQFLIKYIEPPFAALAMYFEQARKKRVAKRLASKSKGAGTRKGPSKSDDAAPHLEGQLMVHCMSGLLCKLPLHFTTILLLFYS